MLALAVTAPLAVLYLLLRPPSGDLAAATYRGDLVARFGFTVWDNGWYGGHALPGYSLLAPVVGAIVGERTLLAVCAVASAGLFGLLAERMFGGAAARAASVSFALGVAVGLLSGRVAYGLGLTVGMLSLAALALAPLAAGLLLAALTSLASPIAGSFLALAGLGYALAALPPPTGERPPSVGGRSRSVRRGLLVAAAALTPIAVMAIAFPEGGWQPFPASMFWPVLAGVVLTALAIPRFGGALPAQARRGLVCGAWLYALALVGAFVLRTPVGDNSVRLGTLLGAPLAVGLLWDRRRLALAMLAPALLFWQLEPSLSDVVALAGTPSVNASYYAPLVSELDRLAGGRPLRVEVPPTEGHWEAVYLPEHPVILLARGWERQLDTRYAPLFYRPGLGPRAYRAWLGENAVSYVALPDVRLDTGGEQEGRLLAHGLPYLEEVWRSRHWRLFAVSRSTPLAQPPAALTSVGSESFTLIAPRPGDFTVRVRYTPYWAVTRGSGSVSQAAGGWTEVAVHRPGHIRVGIELA